MGKWRGHRGTSHRLRLSVHSLGGSSTHHSALDLSSLAMSLVAFQTALTLGNSQINFPSTTPLKPWLYAVAALYALCAVLFFVTAGKRVSGGKEYRWWARRDGQGYLAPNVYLTVPVFAAIYSISER